jgi:hypothetical protein
MKLNRFFERNFPELTEKISLFSKKVKKFFTKVVKFLRYYLKKYFKKLNKEIIRINKEHPEVIEMFQLITIYIFALITFSKYIKGMLRYYPRLLKILVPFCEITGESPLFFYLGHPNYSYLFYTFMGQVLHRKKFIKFSDKIRFHIIYIMLLEMIQSAIVQWIFFFFQIDRAAGIEMRPMLGTIFGTNFLCFYLIYIYSLIMGLKNSLPYFPPALHFLNLCVDSSLFWVGLVQKDKIR